MSLVILFELLQQVIMYNPVCVTCFICYIFFTVTKIKLYYEIINHGFTTIICKIMITNIHGHVTFVLSKGELFRLCCIMIQAFIKTHH